eukprot:TRINITY_DN5867_c0_g2_i1.p1 TRINITY_DN5867_c0_g2~~TRINITY_DN5867_c0_g2_i1.p1  ORF type:complete len:120 (+),score=16.31 TRINITY_DN5867_c0_g2_i1:139-498(+)
MDFELRSIQAELQEMEAQRESEIQEMVNVNNKKIAHESTSFSPLPTQDSTSIAFHSAVVDHFSKKNKLIPPRKEFMSRKAKRRQSRKSTKAEEHKDKSDTRSTRMVRKKRERRRVKDIY